MKKMLIIGQTPPPQEEYPYSKTLLYEMLSWAGVNKDYAKAIFEFECCVEFKKSPNPLVVDMIEYYNKSLKFKMKKVEKVIILGKLVEDFYTGTFNGKYTMTHNHPHLKLLVLPHPTYCNYTTIMDAKAEITYKLRNFLYL